MSDGRGIRPDIFDGIPARSESPGTDVRQYVGADRYVAVCVDTNVLYDLFLFEKKSITQRLLTVLGNI